MGPLLGGKIPTSVEHSIALLNASRPLQPQERVGGALEHFKQAAYVVVTSQLPHVGTTMVPHWPLSRRFCSWLQKYSG